MVREGGGHPGECGGMGVKGEECWKESCTVRGAQMSGSEVAKRYNKIKGENEYGCFLMGQNSKIRSRIKEHVTNSKYTN